MTDKDQGPARPENIVAYFEDFWARQLDALKRFAEEPDQNVYEQGEMSLYSTPLLESKKRFHLN